MKNYNNLSTEEILRLLAKIIRKRTRRKYSKASNIPPAALGASIGAYKTSGDPTILIIGAIAIFNITIISFISNMRLLFNFSKDYNELPRTKRFFIPFGMATTTMLTIAALFNKVSWFLWFFAIFGTLAWIKQIYSHYKMGNHIKIENK